MSLKTVHVPDQLAEIFSQAEEVVGRFFKEQQVNPASGTINIFNSRYILLRGPALSIEFFMLVRKIYGKGNELEADQFSASLLYDLAHAIGKSDAQNFHDEMGLKEPIAKLSAGPIHFSHAGWAFVSIDLESNPEPNENFVLHYAHPFSFEADAWHERKELTNFPVCVMNAGYSSGWCEASFGLLLEAREISCRAQGDDECRFIMAPPQHLERHVHDYLARHPEVAKHSCSVQAADFFFHGNGSGKDKKRKQSRQKEAMAGRIFAYARQLEIAKEELQKKISELENEVKERKAAEEKLSLLANFDHVTELCSRGFFLQRVESDIARARRDDYAETSALLFIDLDNFKRVNDGLGHDVGDELLHMVGRLLKKHTRNNNVVARLGGDEFAIWLRKLDFDDVPGRVAERLVQVLEKPIQIGSHEVEASGSIGIAIFPDDGQDLTQLLRNADIAMYEAKHNGGNSYQHFTNDMHQKVRLRLSLDKALHKAVKDGRIDVHYQPKAKLPAMSYSGAEALARWHDDEYGWVPPDTFIQLAEESNLINALGELIFTKAFTHYGELVKSGLSPGLLAVNLSPKQFRQKDLLKLICSTAEATGFSLHNLQLEITESTAMDDASKAMEIMHALKEMGIQLAIDDFGTGYSSLAYLTNFPVDTLKIDRAFVQSMSHMGDSHWNLINTIINLGHNLGISIVAEGAENAHHIELLSDLGCDEIQGYHYAKPLSLNQFQDFIPRTTPHND